MRTVCQWFALAWCFTTAARAPGAGLGEIRVEGGTLQVAGTVEAGRVVVGPAGTLTGNGTIAGNVEVAGAVAPGVDGVGTLTVSGNVTFAPGSSFPCDVSSHTQTDRIVASGSVGGSCVVSVRATPDAAPVDEVIVQGSPASDYAGFAPSDAWTWGLSETGSVNLALTHLRFDTDGDGLPDWWEKRWFANRTAANAAADTDGDTASSKDEYGADTDPLDCGSALELLSVQRVAPSNTVLRWTTAGNREYQVLRYSSLSGGTVSTAAVITAYACPVHTWTNSAPDGAQVFYRVTVREAPP